MFSVGKSFVALATLPLAAAAFLAPATTFAAELPVALLKQAAYSTTPAATFASADPAHAIWDQALTAVDLAIAAEPEMTDDAGSYDAETATIDPELECMAKIVHHEAGNQSRRGQLAVAQTIMNRMASGRFASTICGVANQPGQFFRTADYDPDRSGAQWKSAVAVSRQARRGASADVAAGALFFRASYASATRFFRGRQQVATLGGHIFYR